MSKKPGRAEVILREQGARVTPQRVAILMAVAETGDPPDADSVYRHVSREYPHISRDTVYRTLSMMEEKKIIGSVLFGGASKRDGPNTGKHHHLICLRCRRIIDFSSNQFDRIEVPSSAMERFTVVRTTVHVEGICDECQGRNRA